MVFGKRFLILAISAIILFQPLHRANAFWGEVTANFVAQRIYDEVKEALVDALQQAAIQMVTDTINNAIVGTTNAGSLFIADWEEYLFSSPAAQTSVYMNDFFTITSRGRSSGLNYSSRCGGNLSQWRQARAAESVNVVIDWTDMQSDLEDYVCDVAEMFEDGVWDAFDAFFLNPANNGLGYSMIAEGVKEERQRELEKKAEVQAIAYKGYKATFSSDGRIVITPGSTTQDIQSKALGMSADALTNADSLGEVVVSTVAKLMGSVVRQGIGYAQRNAQQAINQTICEASNDLYGEMSKFSPDGSLFEGLGIGSLGRTSGETCTLR